jgi:spore coat polysaccharide biosynthesis protein SpsF (cytidylyltransferase family)
MKTAKQMLAIAKAVQAVRAELDSPYWEKQAIVEKIAAAAACGEDYIQHFHVSKGFKAELESLGYEVSDAIYEGEDCWEHQISWGDYT